LVALLIGMISSARCAPGDPVPSSPASQEAVLALADSHLRAAEARLDSDAKRSIDDLRTQLWMNRSQEVFFKRTVDGLVDHLTLKLAGLKNFDALIAGAALLVQAAPKSARTATLFGAVLHTADQIPDAVTVLEYTVSLTPKSQLARLNLANAYLDVGRWEDGRALADGVVAENEECMAAHKVLSLYWYEKKDLGRFRDELLRASRFKGFVRGKLMKKSKRIAEQEVQPEDSIGAMEAKALQLGDEVPTTTADIIEDEFPEVAKQIRDKYGRLADNEKMILPKLPSCDTTSPPGFRRSKPIIEAWVKVFAERSLNLAKAEALRHGINPNADKKTIRAQGQAAAQKELAKQLQNAQGMIDFMANMENLPGTQRAKLNQAKQKLQQAAQKQGVELVSAPVDPNRIPGFDSGPPLVQANYYDYLKISRTYEMYFLKYYKDFTAKVADIDHVYGDKVKEENDRHEELWKKLQEEHQQGGNPHGDVDRPCREEVIRHKKALNAIAQDYYQQWAGVFFPQYVGKMKPTLDAYWRVCMLYVRNMNDPEVLRREHSRVISTYTVYLMQAGAAIGGGAAFAYQGPTDEEERQLEHDVALAKEEAEAKKPEFRREFKEPEFDLSAWLEDHLVFEVSGEFLSLKITAKSIEFEAWAFGPGAGIKYDWSAQQLESYTGVGAKFKVGLNVAGVEMEVEAKGDFVRKTATWDFAKGTYEESYGAKGEAKAGVGMASVSGEFAVNTQLEAKVASKVSLGDLSVQEEAEFK
jgi:hypothetical protein